jgi:predicted metal-binding protein
MVNRKQLDALFKMYGYTDFKWIESKDIVVAQWVRMKCMFGCSEYGRNAACPPNVPSTAECQQFFSEYSTAVLFHFE